MLNHVELGKEQVFETGCCALVKHQIHVGASHLSKQVHLCYQVDEWDLDADQ